MDSKTEGGEELNPVVQKPKGAFALREEEVLDFWNKEKIFEKTLEKKAPKGEYVFYDGPPFATGLPHYGHLLQSALKDAIPRYKTMQGYRVSRQWGWDCHGLPLENQIEQELGFKTKRDIEQYGIEKFNAAAKNAVLRYAADWRRIIPRVGRWADMEHDYKTMDATYTESVWWAFKTLYDKGLIYEGFKAMHLCPRCGTTLSNFEVAQGYQDIDDHAVTVKLPLVDEPETALLIWTTTPWTLPGNSAAAVNAGATYVKVRTDEGFVIVAKELMRKVLGEHAQVFGEILGKELVGQRYEPPFAYFKDLVHKHKTHAWKVYAAPYVTLEDGTGIVHLAPAYGAEDLELAQKEKIPLIHHVTDDGKFVAAVTDFAGLPVKPKGRHMETDVKVIELLRAKGLLFKDEKIKHSYPHCWRCDTPLLNWAANSWFVKVSALKSQLLRENKKVTWVPGHVGQGRFAKLIESAPDWAISRSRYWGAPIPVWRHSKTKEIKVIGSVADLLPLVRRSGNRYFVMRHGEAEQNTLGIISSSIEKQYALTEKGRDVAREAAEKLKAAGTKIDMICVSPLLRTQQTAKIAADILGVSPDRIFVDERLREMIFGELEEHTVAEHKALYSNSAETLSDKPEGGESAMEVKRRVGAFLFELESRYPNKNILIVSHGNPLWMLAAAADGATKERTWELYKTAYPHKGRITELPFAPYPHNDDYELDLHRPYIDDLSLGNSIAGEWQRVPDVFDCWFESGSMPFASHHYPFDKTVFNPKRFLGLFPKGFPAGFIAEGIDQTRGWFYSMIVLGVGLFGHTPYKAVVTNGMILAEDGRKMSKKLKNYPDPMDVVDQFGADALRYYILSSPVIRGEDLRFAARGVEEVSKKLLMRLDNVRSFYDLYAPAQQPTDVASPETLSQKSSAAPRLFARELSASLSIHPLDRWILSRLNELVRDATQGYETYELDLATRPLAGFIDDLSTWYLRRSRDRFKTDSAAPASHLADKDAALATLRQVLLTVSKVMAPAMPFFADDLYRRLRAESDPESVHLADWPVAGAIDTALLADMQRVRDISSRGLELREKAGIKIRQPLASLAATSLPIDPALHQIIADELNVKQVIEATPVVSDVQTAGGIQTDDVLLNIELTPELREEGLVRELVRAVQDVRKKTGLVIADHPTVYIYTNAGGSTFFQKNASQIESQTNASLVIEQGDVSEAVDAIDGLPFPLMLSVKGDHASDHNN